MNALPILCAIDNRGVPGMVHCFGAPFIAKDFDIAKEMVKEAIGDKKDLLNLECFYLVQLGFYDVTSSDPLIVADPSKNMFVCENICVADLFDEEENPADDIACCPRGDEGIMTGVGFYDESEVADEQE